MSAIFCSVSLDFQVEGMDVTVLVDYRFILDYLYAFKERKEGLETWYHVGTVGPDGQYEQDDLPRLTNFAVALQHANYDQFTILSALLRDWYSNQSLVLIPPRYVLEFKAAYTVSDEILELDRFMGTKRALWTFLAIERRTYLRVNGLC